MTAKEIRAMPAGIDMDRLIAEKVTGICEHYSTHLPLAIECLEHFAKLSWHLSKIRDGYRCQVVQAASLTQCFEAEADTAPLAICRAVLLAALLAVADE